MTLNLNAQSDFLNPFLISEQCDLLAPFSEKRLQTLAKSIPAHGHHQPVSATQSCISATIHATQEYLSQLITGLSLANPSLARFLVVSTSGLDAIQWLKKTSNTCHGWIPIYPVTGFITFGRLQMPPSFGRTPLEPSVVVSVNRSDDGGNPDFLVEFTVSDADDMRALSMLFNDAGDLWDKFEDIFSVTPFTSIPLPDEVDSGTELSCREYLSLFLKNVVDKADDGCLEGFELQFSTDKCDSPKFQIAAAIAVLNAFGLYLNHKKVHSHKERRTMLLGIISAAIKTGIENDYWIEKERDVSNRKRKAQL